MQHEQVLRNMFTGKTVAVVGNADSLFPRQYGTEIDSHDIVVRINKGACICFGQIKPAHRISHGAKTDVWVMGKMEVKRVLPKHRKAAKLAITTDKEPPARRNEYIVCYDHVPALQERLGSSPSTGARLLDLLTRLDCKSVDIYGFDWKETDTFYERNRRREIHDFPAERDFCLEYLEKQHGFAFHGITNRQTEPAA